MNRTLKTKFIYHQNLIIKNKKNPTWAIHTDERITLDKLSVINELAIEFVI